MKNRTIIFLSIFILIFVSSCISSQKLADKQIIDDANNIITSGVLNPDPGDSSSLAVKKAESLEKLKAIINIAKVQETTKEQPSILQQLYKFIFAIALIFILFIGYKILKVFLLK